ALALCGAGRGCEPAAVGVYLPGPVGVRRTGLSVPARPSSRPLALEEKATDPAGADFVPVSVSDTVTEQVLVSLIGNVDGEQLVTSATAYVWTPVTVCSPTSLPEPSTTAPHGYEAVR